MSSVLSVASVGLTRRELLEQSNCFIFTDEHLITFNGEVLTRVVSPLPEVQGAVSADDLLKLLSKFPDDEVDVFIKGSELRIKAKRRSAGLTLQAEVNLPFEDVPVVKKYRKLPDKVAEVLQRAAKVCGKDETMPRTTEVMVDENLIQACDNYRLFQYEAETGFKQQMLLPASTLSCVEKVPLSGVAVRGGWVHFKTPTGHEISLRCSQGDWPDLSALLDMVEGEEITLPSTLGEILGRAEVMHESAHDAVVDVSIEEMRLTLKAVKDSGWYRETKKIQYKGRPLRFQVHPKFLEDILKETRDVLIEGNRLKLESGPTTFVVCLEVNEE